MKKIIFLFSYLLCFVVLHAVEIQINTWTLHNDNKKLKRIQLNSNELSVSGNLKHQNSIESPYFEMEPDKISPIEFSGEVMLEKGQKSSQSLVCFDIRMIYVDGTQGFQVITPAFPKEYGKWIPVSRIFSPAKPVKKLNVMCLNYNYSGKAFFRNAKLKGDLKPPVTTASQAAVGSDTVNTIKVVNWVAKKHKRGGNAIKLRSADISIDGDLNDEKSVVSETFMLEQSAAKPISFSGEVMRSDGASQKNSLACFDLFLTYQDGTTGWIVITPALPKQKNQWIKVQKTFTPAKPVKKLDVMCLNYNYSGKAFFRNAELKFASPVHSLKGVKYHSLENSKVKYVFAELDGQVWLSSLKEKSNSFDFIEKSNQKSNLFLLDMIAGKKNLKQISGGGKVSFSRPDKSTLKITWRNIALEKGSVDVTATVKLSADAFRAFWNIETNIKNSNATLEKVTYPLIADMKVPGNADKQFLFFPQDIGRLLKNPETNLRPLSIEYGSWHMTMQFMALYGQKRGWYMAADDGNGYAKKFIFYKRPGKNAYFFGVERLMEVGSKKYVSTYSVEAGVFKGDWYDAAQIYRQWALKQKWCQAGPLIARKNFPKSITDFGGMYLTPPHRGKTPPEIAANRAKLKPREYSFIPDEELKEKYAPIIDIKDALRAYNREYDFYKFPLVYYASLSYIEPFGVSTTRYIPVTGMPELMRELIKKNIYFLAWTSIQGMDTNIPRWKKDNAQNYVVVDRDGQVDICGFDHGCIRAQMCSATDYWKNMVYEFTERLLGYGFRFIYYDELASSGPRKCYNPAHGHPLGGGNYGLEARREILKNLHEKFSEKYPDFNTSGEELSEYYIDVNDANFLYASLFDDSVPAFQAVYHEYSFCYGEGPYGKYTVQNVPEYYAEMGGSSGLEDYATSFGRNWTFGIHPGVNRPEMPEFSPIAAAMGRHFGEKWLKYKKFLIYGRMLRPPVIESPFMITAGWRYHKELMKLPSVFASLWRAADGEYAITLANAQNIKQAPEMTLSLKESGFKGKYCKIYDPETGEIFYSGSTDNPRFRAVIDGYRTRVLLIAPVDKVEKITAKIPPYTVALEHTFTEARKSSVQTIVLRVENITDAPATACVLAAAGEKWVALPAAKQQAIIQPGKFKDFTFKIIVPDGPAGRYSLSYSVDIRGKVNKSFYDSVPFGLHKKEDINFNRKKYNVSFLKNAEPQAVYLPANIPSFGTLENKLTMNAKKVPAVKSRAAWNENGLYLTVEVPDDLHYQTASGEKIWKGDGIQIRYGAPQKDQNKINYYNIGLTIKDGKPYAVCYEDMTQVNSISYTAVHKNGLSTYNIFISAKMLRIDMRENMQIPFSFAVNVHDGKLHQGWLQWTGGVCGPQDVRLLGELILKK